MAYSHLRSTYIKQKISNIISISGIVTIHYFEFDKNFMFEGEKHDFWEMVYVDSGKVNVSAGEREFTLSQGDAVFHKPNEFHRVFANGVDIANVFIISFTTTSKLMDFFKNKSIKIQPELKKFISMILAEGEKTFDLPLNNPYLLELPLAKNPPFGGVQLIRLYLEELLILLIRAEENEEMQIFCDKKSMENHLADSVAEIINENIYGRITVSEICQRLHYSKTYISEVFKYSYKCTIVEYCSRQKIGEAKKLIRKGAYTFSQISEMLCFDNPHYFTRVFKRVANMTPREYASSVKS